MWTVVCELQCPVHVLHAAESLDDLFIIGTGHVLVGQEAALRFNYSCMFD